MDSYIASAIAGVITVFIIVVGFYVQLKGGTWQDFWQGTLRGKSLKKGKADKDKFLKKEIANIFKQIDEERKALIIIKFIFGGIVGIVACFSVFYCFIYGVFSKDPFADSLFKICLIGLAFIFVYGISYQKIYIAILFRGCKNRDYYDDVEAEGYIYEVVTSSHSSSQSRVGRRVNILKESQTYWLLIAIKGNDGLLRAKIKYSVNYKKNPYKELPATEPKRGDIVVIRYDKSNPKYCFVPSLEILDEYKDSDILYNYEAIDSPTEPRDGIGAASEWASLKLYKYGQGMLSFEYPAMGSAKNVEYKLEYTVVDNELTIVRRVDDKLFASVFCTNDDFFEYKGIGKEGEFDPVFSIFYPKFKKIILP